MTVPQEYWAGYSKVTKYFEAGDRALNGFRYKEAIADFNINSRRPVARIFPTYAAAKEKRSEAFNKYFDENFDSLSKAMTSGADIKQKIAANAEAAT